jgi:hypothetical protein
MARTRRSAGTYVPRRVALAGIAVAPGERRRTVHVGGRTHDGQLLGLEVLGILLGAFARRQTVEVVEERQHVEAALQVARPHEVHLRFVRAVAEVPGAVQVVPHDLGAGIRILRVDRRERIPEHEGRLLPRGLLGDLAMFSDDVFAGVRLGRGREVRRPGVDVLRPGIDRVHVLAGLVVREDLRRQQLLGLPPGVGPERVARLEGVLGTPARDERAYDAHCQQYARCHGGGCGYASPVGRSSGNARRDAA